MKKLIISLIATLLIANVVTAQFTPVWTGNGNNHMNFYIFKATIDGIDLEVNDQIGIFDGNKCVGAAIVSDTITTTSYLSIITSMSDSVLDPNSEDNGFVPGNNITFKIYDNSKEKVLTNIQVIYSTGTGKFVASGSASLTLNALSPNVAPYFTSDASESAQENVLFEHIITVADVNINDFLTIKPVSIPKWLTLVTDNANKKATLTGTPGDEAALKGTENIQVSVTDGKIATPVLQNIEIAVTNVNDAPVIVSTPVTFVQTNSTYTYQLKVNDPDPNESLSFSGTGLPNWLNIPSSDGLLTGETPSTAGEFPVTISVSDGEATASQTFTIKVSASNEPPIFVSQAIKTAKTNQLYVYNITGSDADAGTSLIFSASGLPSWLTLTDNQNGTAVLKGTPLDNDVGTTDNIEIYLSDGIAADTQSFQIIVESSGNAPQILTTSLSNPTKGELYNQVVQFRDNDNTSITVKLVDAPLWMNIQEFGVKQTIVNLTDNEGSITLTGTPGPLAPLKSQVVIEANDGQFVRAISYIIELDVLNNPPEAKDFALTIKEDKPIFVTLFGLDNETPNTLLFDTISSPKNGVIEILSLNLYSYRPNLNFFGKDSFVYLVTDPGGLKDSGKVVITVEPVNDPPTIAIQNSQLSMYENDSLIFPVTMLDITDGEYADSLTFANEFGPFNGVISTVGQTPTAASIKYIPRKNFIGVDVIFLAAIETSGTNKLTSKPLLLITIEVKNVNEPPITFDREVFMKEDRIKTFRIFAFDREDDVVDLTYEVIVPPGEDASNSDSIKFDKTNKNIVTYYPKKDFPKTDSIGIDSFKYVVIDLEGGRDTGKVTLNILQVKDKPIGIDTTIEDVDKNDTVQIDFSNLVSDAENDIGDLKIKIFQNKGIFNGTIEPTDSNMIFDYYRDANKWETEFVMYRVLDSDSMLSKPYILRIDSLLGGDPLPEAKADTGGYTYPSTTPDTIRLKADESIVITVFGVDGSYPFNELEIDWEIPEKGTFNESKALKAEYITNSPVTSRSALYAPTTSDDQVIVDKIKFKVSEGGYETFDSIIIYVDSVGYKPVIDTLPDQAIDEGNTLDLTINYTDLDTDPSDLSWSLSTPTISIDSIDYEWGTATETQNTVKIIPPADFDGNLVFVVTCKEINISGPQADSVDFTLTVNNINDAPVIKQIEDQTTIQNTSLTLLILAEDIDSPYDSLTYEATSLTGNDSIHLEGNELTLIPKEGYSGTDNIEVIVSDKEDFDTITFNLSVIVADDAPIFNETILPQEIDEDTKLTLHVTPNDSSYDELISVAVTSSNQVLFPADSISVSPVSDYRNVIRTLVFSPIAESAGSAEIDIKLEDSEGNQTVQRFTITVNDIDDAPVIGEIDTIIMDEDNTKWVTLLGTYRDVDSYDFLYGTEITNNKIEIDTIGDYLIISATENFYGDQTFTLYVSDETNTSSKEVNLKVNNTQDIPSVTSKAVEKATQDVPYSYQISVINPDPPSDTLSFIRNQAEWPSWLKLSGEVKGLLSGTPTNNDVNKANKVLVYIADTEDTIKHEFYIEVENVNDKPTFTSKNNALGTQGKAFSFTLTATDVDGDAVTISRLSGNLPNGITFTGNSLVGTPTEAGTFDITFKASDGIGGEETQNFALIIDPSSNINSNSLISYISIYPVPVKDMLYVELNEKLIGEIEINLYTIGGQLMIKNIVNKDIKGTMINQIDVNEIPTGLYQIEISGNDEIYKQKVVIE